MLLELRAQDVALIGAVKLALEPGFNVFTGETGAGKSILIDSIALLLGRRARSSDVRAGATSAYVDGVFALPANGILNATLAAYGIEPDETLLVSREVVPGDPARSVARVNGRAVPVRALAELGPKLIDVHGQTEHQSLFRSARQIEYLDRYGGHTEQRFTMQRLVDQLRDVRSEEAKLETSVRENARQTDLLAFQVDEIDEARILNDEDQTLNAEREVLLNAVRLNELAAESERSLAGDDPAAVADRLAEAIANLTEIAAIDSSIRPLVDQLEEAQATVTDAAQSLASYAVGIESDPSRLAEIDARLEAIATLKRKYGDSIVDVLEFADDARARLRQLDGSQDRRQALSAERLDVEAELTQVAQDLRAKRLATSPRFAEAVVRELKDLSLPNAVFEIVLETHPKSDGLLLDTASSPVRFDRSGVDMGEFHLTVNRGQPLQPLAAVASGGEMSRILLGLKSVLATVDDTPTLIFDEIDVGVGSRRGDVVGQKLATLAQTHQILCVTHLASVAAYADTHFVVEKHDGRAGPVTNIRQLGTADIVEEIAAMGGTRTSAGRNVARDLLDEASAWKDQVAAECARSTSTAR